MEIYFIYRGKTGSKLSFSIDDQVKAYPLPNNCNAQDVYKLKGSNSTITKTNSQVKVAGIEYSYYSPAQAIYNLEGTPDIYSIVNGKKHFISSPASFAEYGYKWSDVKKISAKDLAKYPSAKLVKIPDSSTIYFLYQRPDNKWLKIALNSPTVFVSYPGNYWGNVITINRYDFDSYPEVKLIKANGDSAVYYLEGNTRRLVTEDIFVKKGFNPAEVVEVNKTHLESYKLGNILN